MGTTSPLAFPYPEPTDPIAQGADAIKNLANAIDDALGDAWVILSLGSGISVASGYPAPAVRKVTPWCAVVRGAVTSSAAISAQATIATIPAGPLRPIATNSSFIWSSNQGTGGTAGSASYRGVINANGNILIQPTSATVNVGTILGFDGVIYSLTA